MKTYIFSYTEVGGSSTHTIQASTMQEAQSKFEASYLSGKVGQYSYTMKEVGQINTPQVDLIEPTLALIGCIIFAVVADWKIKRWLED